MNVSSEEKSLMARYGITSEIRPIYCYKNFQYRKLQDAINYAKRDIQPIDSDHALETQKDSELKRTEIGNN